MKFDVLLFDFQSKPAPALRLSKYSGGLNKEDTGKKCIKCLCFDWSLVIYRTNFKKHSVIENMPKYVIFQ